MPSELRFTCALEHGIHARPASVLAEAIRPFAAQVQLLKDSTGQSADVRSVLSVVALDVAQADACVVRAEGSDAHDAIEALREVIEQGFGEAAAIAEAEALASSGEASVPAGLRKMNVRWIAGRAISPGFAQGLVAIVRSLTATVDERASRSPEIERAAAHAALLDVWQAISARHDTAGSDLQRDLLMAHMAIAEDPALRAKIDEEVHGGASAAGAVRRASVFFANTLKAAASAYVRDRAIDVEDVAQQILERLGASRDASIALTQPAIIVADLLTPRQMMQIDRKLARGLVLGSVGATSHTAILARAMGIPAIADVHDVENAFTDNQQVIVDADGAFVLPAISEEVRRYYLIEQLAVERRRKRLAPLVGKPGKTRDGARLEIGANVSTADEVAHAMRDGAEGIGLFRTEMLFLDRAAAPSEEEQFQVYARAVEHARKRRKAAIIFRTFDIGGDKPAPYLRIAREENPFLGRRGFRLYEQSPDLLTAQLRAIIRASAKGPVKIMAPMISNLREATWFVARVREVQAQLRKERVRFDAKMPIGVMIEVPAAALAIDHLAKVVDFFSIGTNDLCQYFLAADRGNPGICTLCDPLEPAFLRLLKMIVDAAHRHKRWVGVCGEMAGDVRNLPLMVGLGVDEISVSPLGGRVLNLKAALRDLNRAGCRRLWNRVTSVRDIDAVRSALASFERGGRHASRIIEPDLIAIGSDANSKVEAIKELVGLIVAAGRAADAHALENAVWAREETFSTGVGHGFAIPHCKSDSVRSPTIALLRLKNPIDWGASDGEPVRIAIMLAIPDSGAAGGAADSARTHMQVLAQLARQLMHEDFRERLLRATNPKRVVEALSVCVEH